MEPEQGESLLNRKAFIRSVSHANDELQSFRSCLRWMCVDQSDRWRAVVSWTLFVLLAVAVPCLSHFVLSCPRCDGKHRRPYDIIVQPSLSVIAIVSFFCLSRFVKKYGLRRFLFLDKLCGESEIVRKGYITQLNKSFKLLSIFVVPCFIAESAYKIWWYASGASQIPFLGNVFVSDAIACILELCSWIYRTSVFFLVCVLFRIICYLQILRLEDFTKVFQEESDVALVLKEHLRIRRHLKIISHRYRAFILLILFFVTASQLAALLITTKAHADVNIFRGGELALCSVSLVTGLFICLRSAAKITHKAQAITSHAAKWHACATIDSFDGTDSEKPTPVTPQQRHISADGDSDHESCDDEDGDETKIVLPNAQTISFQKRQALGEPPILFQSIGCVEKILFASYGCCGPHTDRMCEARKFWSLVTWNIGSYSSFSRYLTTTAFLKICFSKLGKTAFFSGLAKKLKSCFLGGLSLAGYASTALENLLLKSNYHSGVFGFTNDLTYFENNRAGITVFGFTLDRAWLHMIFGIQLSLVLWLLGKTVGI